MYFAVIFGSHISCVFLPMAYLPNIYSCVVAYAHFTCFCGMLINSIFVTEKHPGRGGKTKANRVFWFRNSSPMQSCAASTLPSSWVDSSASTMSSSDPFLPYNHNTRPSVGGRLNQIAESPW